MNNTSSEITVEIDFAALNELQYTYLLKNMTNYHEMLGQVFINKPDYWAPTTSDIPLESVGFRILKVFELDDKWFMTIHIYNTLLGLKLQNSLRIMREASEADLYRSPTLPERVSFYVVPKVAFRPHAFKIGNIVKIYTINCFISNYEV